MVKTVTFWTSVNILIVSALKLSFFPLFPFLSVATQKSGGGGGGGWGEVVVVGGGGRWWA